MQDCCRSTRQFGDVLFQLLYLFRTLDRRYFDRCNLALGTDLHWCPMAQRVLHMLLAHGTLGI